MYNCAGPNQFSILVLQKKKSLLTVVLVLARSLNFIGSHMEPSLADIVNPSDVNQLTISRGGARTLVGRAAARVQLGSSHVSLCSI